MTGLMVEDPGLEPQMGNPRIVKIDVHQLKLSSLSITCDIHEKLDSVLYSVSYDEANKIPYIMYIDNQE